MPPIPIQSLSYLRSACHRPDELSQVWLFWVYVYPDHCRKHVSGNVLTCIDKASPFLYLLLDEVLNQIRWCYIDGLLNGWLLFPVLSLRRILMGQFGVCSDATLLTPTCLLNIL